MSNIETRKLATGTTYRVRWRADGQQHKSPAFDTRSEAEDYKKVLDGEEVSRGQRRNTVKSKTPFREYAETWLASRSKSSQNRASRTRERAALNAHLVPAFGDTEIGAISRADIQQWVNGVEKTLKPRSVAAYYQVLSVVLKDAALDGYLPKGSPAVKSRIQLPTPQKRMVFLSDDETEKLLILVAELRPADYALIHIAAHTGMRQGELFALHRDMVDVGGDEPQLKVVSGAKIGLDGRPVIGSTKTATWRHVALFGCCVDVLRQQLAAHAHPMVFPAPAGGIMNAHNWRKRGWYEIAEAFGRPELHFHDLRHSHVASLLAASWDVIAVQERLGHTSAKMTLDVYGHVAIGRQHELLRQKGIRPAAPRTDQPENADPYAEACEECGAVPGRACFNLDGSGFLRNPHPGR